MIDSIVAGISKLFTAIPFSAATWFVVLFIGFFIWLFAKASRDPNSPIKWEHLIIDSENDRASPYKVGYMIGVVVSSWIILQFFDRDKLTYDVFGMYLTYLLGGAGWNTFVKNRSEGNMSSRMSGNYGGNPYDEQTMPVSSRLDRTVRKPQGADDIEVGADGKLR